MTSISDFAPETLLTPKEVADVLRKHAKTITSMCATGELVAVRIGRQYRIKAADVSAFIAKNTLPYSQPIVIPRKARR